jgi:hypothetical protein
MRVLDRRLRRLEVGLLPVSETAGEPPVIIVDYVSAADGEVSEAYRVTLPNAPAKWMPRMLSPDAGVGWRNG